MPGALLGFDEDGTAVEFTMDMVGCARCHTEGHRGVVFKPLTHPMDTVPWGRVGTPAAPLTHWAPCPVNGEPILYTVINV